MKVLQINSTNNVGSTGRIAENIGKKIIGEGGQSYIAYGRAGNPSQSIPIKIGSKYDQFLHLLGTRIFDTHGFHSKRATVKLISQIESIKPDIIHLHNLHGYYLNIDVLFKFLKCYNKPVVWTLHDCWAFTGHCCYYERVKCEKWKKSCYKCPLKTGYPKSYIIDNSAKNYTLKRSIFNQLENLTLVPVSLWLSAELKHTFLFQHQIHTIQNGVDIDKFKYSDPSDLIEKLNLKGKKVLLGVANKWSNIKGLKDFIDLAKLIDDSTQIILIGLSKNQIINLPNNIIGISKLNSQSELVKFYSLADVFVNPSIAESFGLVTVEAMACGTPVAGYNSTATPELIKPGTGFVVERNDINGLFEKTKLLLQNKSLYSKKCRKNVVENFNNESQLDKYIELYKSKL